MTKLIKLKRKRKTKRTEINYKVTQDNKIQIIYIRNCAKMSEIKTDYGYEVERVYSNGVPCYSRITETVIHLNYRVENATYLLTVSDGEIISKETFSLVINTMRAAGKRLQEIIKKENQFKVKTILI